MKALHRQDLWSWSSFDETRNIDFHSVLWVRPGGNVAFDPLALSAHDLSHLKALGGVSWIAITNADHIRAADQLRSTFGAKVAASAAEMSQFKLPVDVWLTEGDALVPQLKTLTMDGSKTPGELAFVLDKTTLITGDLVRGQRGGKLNLLPDPKLTDRSRAVASVQRLAALEGIEAVLVGDGWPVFRDGGALLRELSASL